MKIGGWLYLAATNIALNLRKTENRRRRNEKETFAMRQESMDAPDKSWIEIKPLVDELIAALPIQQRQALVMRFFEGRQENEIATALACPRSTVASWIQRGLEKMRGGLQKKGVVVSVLVLTTLLTNNAKAATATLISKSLIDACIGRSLPSPAVETALRNSENLIYWKSAKIAAGVLVVLCAIMLLIHFSASPRISQDMPPADPEKALVEAVPAPAPVKKSDVPKTISDLEPDPIQIGCKILGGSQNPSLQFDGTIQGFAISPDSRSLAVSYYNNTKEGIKSDIIIMDLLTFKERQRIQRIKGENSGQNILFGSDSDTLFFPSVHDFHGWIEEDMKNNGIVMWDISKNQEILRFKFLNPMSYSSVGFFYSPEKSKIIVPFTSTYLKYVNEGVPIDNNKIKELRDKAKTDLEKMTPEEKEKYKNFLKKRQIEIRDEKELLERISEGKIFMYKQEILNKAKYSGMTDLMAFDTRTGEQTFTFEKAGRTVEGNMYDIGGISISPDASIIICHDNLRQGKTGQPDNSPPMVTVYDFESQKKLYQWSMPAGYNWPKNQIKLIDNERVLFGDIMKIGGNCLSLILNVADGSVIRELPGKSILSPDRKTVITYQDDSLHIIDTETWKEKGTPITMGEHKWVNGLAISPDSKWLIGTLSNRNMLLIYNLQTEQLVSPKEDSHQSTPNWLDFSSDGSLLVSDEDYIYHYDGATGQSLNGYTINVWNRYANKVITPDGKQLLNPGSQSSAPELLDAVTGTLLHKFNGGSVETLFMSEDGRYAAAKRERGGLDFLDLQNRKPLCTITNGEGQCIWNKSGDMVFIARGATGAVSTSTGQQIFRFQSVEGNEIEAAGEIAYSSSGNMIYVKYIKQIPIKYDPVTKQQTGGPLNMYFLCSATNGNFVRSLPDLSSPVDFSDDGRLLLSPDGAVDVATGEWIWKFKSKEGDQGVRQLSRSKRFLSAFGKENSIRIYDAETGKMLQNCRVEMPEGMSLNVQKAVWSQEDKRMAITLKGRPEVVLVELPPL